MTAILMAQIGRPAKTGPISEIERERGRKVAAWIRSGMMPPHQIVELNNRDVARLTDLSASTVGNYLNDCYDRHANRMKFPKISTIKLIAEKLNISEQDGLVARFWVPSPKTSKSNFGVSGQFPQSGTMPMSFRILKQAFAIYEKHAYEGRIPEEEVDRIVELMLSSVEVHGTEPPEQLADYSKGESDDGGS